MKKLLLALTTVLLISCSNDDNTSNSSKLMKTVSTTYDVSGDQVEVATTNYSNGRITDISKIYYSDPESIDLYNYSYYDNGLLSKITRNQYGDIAQTLDYIYDDQGRIIKVISSVGESQYEWSLTYNNDNTIESTNSINSSTKTFYVNGDNHIYKIRNQSPLSDGSFFVNETKIAYEEGNVSSVTHEFITEPSVDTSILEYYNDYDPSLLGIDYGSGTFKLNSLLIHILDTPNYRIWAFLETNNKYIKNTTFGHNQSQSLNWFYSYVFNEDGLPLEAITPVNGSQYCKTEYFYH